MTNPTLLTILLALTASAMVISYTPFPFIEESSRRTSEAYWKVVRAVRGT